MLSTIRDAMVRGGTGRANYGELGRLMDGLARLGKAEVLEIARGLEISRSLPTKASAILAIRGRLYGPLDTFNRTSF